MKCHAATYEHERLRPDRLPVPRLRCRTVHLLPAIAEPVTSNLADVARRVLEAVAQDGGASVDLVAGRFFVRKSYEAPVGRAVGIYNCKVTPSEIADDLQYALETT